MCFEDAKLNIRGELFQAYFGLRYCIQLAVNFHINLLLPKNDVLGHINCTYLILSNVLVIKPFDLQIVCIFIRAMKTSENIFTKITVVSLSVLYLFIALTYVLFLPNYNNQRSVSKQASYNHTVLLPSKKNIGYNAGKTPLLEKVFKTTIQHKKDIFIALLAATVVITSATIAAGFLVNVRPQFVYADSYRYTYLQVCALRI